MNTERSEQAVGLLAIIIVIAIIVFQAVALMNVETVATTVADKYTSVSDDGDVTYIVVSEDGELFTTYNGLFRQVVVGKKHVFTTRGERLTGRFITEIQE